MANRSEDRKKNFESVFEEMESKYGSKKKDEKSSTPTTSNTPTLTPGASREVKQAKRQQNFNNVYSDMEVRYGAASGVTPGYISAFYDDSRNFIIRSASRLKGIDWDAAMSEGTNKTWNNEYNSLREREEKIRSYLRENKDSLDPEFYKSISSYLDNFHWSSVDAKVSFSKANKHFSKYKSQDDWFNNAPENYEQRIKKYEDARNGDEVPEEFEDYLKIDKYGYSRYDYDVMARNNQKYLPKYEKMGYIELAKASSELPDGEEKDWLDSYIQGRKEEYHMSLDGKAIEEAEKAYKNRFGDTPTYDAISQATNEQDAEIIFNHLEALNAKETQKKAKEKEKYLGVGDPRSEYYDPDFAKKAAAGDEEFGALEAAYIIGTGSVQEGFELSQLTDKEKDTLRYHYHEGGLDGAKEYLEHLQPDLARRYADYRYEKMEGNTFLEIAFGIEAGINQFGRGLEGWFTDEPLPYNSTEILSSYVSNDLADVGPKIPFTGGKTLGQTGFDTVTTLSNMVPTLAISTVAPTTGAVLMGASAGGNAYQEKLRAGYSADEAAAYGILVGTSEAILERFIGSVAKVSGKGLTKLTGKALDSIDNAFSRFAKTWGGQVLLKAGSEGGEEFLQAVLEPYLWQIASGEEATVDLEEAVYSALMGAFTGGMLGGGQSAINSAVTHHNQRNLGRTIVAADGGMDLLMNFANEVAGVSPNSANRINEQAKVAQDKFNAFNAKNESRVKAGKKESGPSKRTARKIGELYQTTTEAYKSYAKEQNVADVAKSLEEKGFAPETANKVAKALLANSEADLTRAQKQILEAAKDDPDIQKTVQDIIVNPESTMGQRNRKISDLNDAINLGLIVNKLKNSQSGEVSSDGNATAETSYDVSTDGKTLYNGKPVSIKEIVAIKDGKMTLRLEDGTEVDAKDIIYGSNGEALIYESVANMGIDAKAANNLVNSFKNQKGETVLSAEAFAAGITEAFRYGQQNIDPNAMKDSTFASKLNPGQQEYAYRRGQEAAGKQVAKDQAIASRNRRLGKTNGKSGKLHFERAGRTFTHQQEAGLHHAEIVANVFGNDVYIHESYRNENGELVYKDVDGVVKPMDDNGWYDPNDGSIHLDLNSGKDGTKTILFTLAHELVHVIKDQSPKDFKLLANFLMEQFATHTDEYGNKINVDELIQMEAKKQTEHGYGVDFYMKKKGMSRVQAEQALYDAAFEEVVCESMETMLSSGRVAETLVDMKRQGGRLAKIAQDIVDAIKNFIEKLKLYLQAYEGVDPTSIEGKLVAMMEENVIKRFEDIITTGLVNAAENMRTAADAVAEGGFVGGYSGTTYNATQAGLLASVSTEGLQNAADLAGKQDVTFNHIGINDQQTKQQWVDAGLAYVDKDADGNEIYVVNDAMLLDERDRRHNAGKETKASNFDMEPNTDVVPVEKTVKHSFTSLAEAAGFEAVENDDGTRAYMRNGARVTEVTVEDIENSPIGAMINYSLEMKDITKAEADRQKKMFADICSLAAKTNDFSMTMSFMGSAVFTGMKANADKQYGTTYDFPSICTKTQAVIDAMSASMVKLKRGLTHDEILELYRDVFASGNPVPCPECYVFSRWIGIGGLLDNINKYQDYYGKMGAKDAAAAYRKMYGEVEAYAAEQGLTFGKAKGALTSKITKEYVKLLEKVEKADNQGEKVKDLDRAKLASLEKQMNTVKAMTWLENVYFSQNPMTHQVPKLNPRGNVPASVLFDLNKGEAFATQYPEAWAFRTTQGAGYGKAITPYADATLGEGILTTNNTTKTIKAKAAGNLNNIFLQQKGSMDTNAKRTLARARMKQKIQAFLGGQRFQSTSDARYENASDYLLAALEMQAMGGMVQCYTKVDGAVPAFGAWGFSVNQSLMPLGGGLDADGNITDTSVGGMNPKVAFRNREKHETAGTITIGVNDNHIRAMFMQWVRDFIIPYHASGGKANLIEGFRSVQDKQAKKGTFVRSTDYSRTQSDKVLSDVVLRWLGKTDAEIKQIHDRRDARIAILTRGNPNMDVVNGSEFLTNLYEKFNGGEWDGVKVAKGTVESQIFPNEFWDQSVSYEDSQKITEDYLDYCDELGFLHRFSGLVPKDGVLKPVNGYDQFGNKVQLQDLAYQYDENGNKTDKVEPFFWKVLTDRRMYDNSGSYLPQKRVTLNDTTTDTVTSFATGNYGRQYDAELAQKTADKIAKKMVKHSLKVIDVQGNETLVDPAIITREQIFGYLQKAKRRKLVDHTYFPIRSHTPATIIATLREAGISIDDRPLAMQAEKAMQSQRDGKLHIKDGTVIRYHSMTPEEIMEVIDKLDDPEIIIHQSERTKAVEEYGEIVYIDAPDNFAVFVTLDSGKECVAIIEFDSKIDDDFLVKDGHGDEYHTTVTVFEPDVERKGKPFDYPEYLLMRKQNKELEIKKESPKSETALGESHATVSKKELSGDMVSQPSSGVKSKKSQFRDSDYLDAVMRGDMETVQRMVETAARSAEYEATMFHETDAENIHIFDISRGTHGGTDYQTPYGIFTKTSSKSIGLGRRQMKLFVKAHNTLRVENREDVLNKIPGFAKYYDQIQAIDKKYDALANQLEDEELNALYDWIEEHPDVDMDEVFPLEYIAEGKPADIDSPKYLEAHEKYMKNRTEWEETYNAVAVKAKAFITDYLRNNGYDSMYFVVDGGSRGRQTDSLIVLDENQVKSADPVTYDDDGNVIPLSQRFNKENKDIRHQFRDGESVSNRSLLANAFEGIAKPEEQAKVREYKEKVDLINSEEKKLRDLNEQIKELSFSKGPRDTKKIRDLRDEATMTANRISTLDNILLRLEAAKPLQDVLAREKKKAYDRAKRKGDEAMAAYRLETEAKQSEILRDYRETKAALKQQTSDTAIIEKEFIRIAKAYDKLEAKASSKSDKDAQAIADLKDALREESKKHRDDQKTWEREFNRLVREYEYADRNIDRLQDKIEHQRESAKAKVENWKKTAVREKIKNLKAELVRSLSNPTDKKYVPVDLIGAVVDVCNLINDDTDLYKADGSINKAQQKREETKEKLQHLKDEYEKLKSNSDPAYKGEFDDFVYAYLTRLSENFGGKNLNDMTLEELTEMYKILRSISGTIMAARKLIGWNESLGVYEVGDAVVDEQRDIKASRKNGKRNFLGKANDTTLNLSLSPVRNVERMSGYNGDSYLLKLFKKLEQGIRKKNMFVMNAYKSFEHLTAGKEYEDAIYKAVGKEYTDINGRKFRVSKMQMMQAVLSFEREQANKAMSHIENGGFNFADLKMLSKGKLKDAISQEYSHRVPAATNLVADFIDVLKDDKWCQDYMEASRKFFNGMAKDAINDTTIILKHRIVAEDKNYIPFESDKDFVAMEISAENNIQQTINAYGMLKDTEDNAPQPLIITGLNNVIDRHIDMVGNVYGLAIEVRNFNKVWNVHSFDKDGNDWTVKSIIGENWGLKGVKHIEQAVQDIQGPRIRERSAIYDKFKSGYISSTFLLNLSVVTKQIGSLFSATSMIRWRDPVRLIGNLFYTMANSKKISAEVDKYTASAWMRRQGLSDAELHTLMTQAKKKGFFRFLDKLPSVINPTKWITAMDHAVALSLWRYAKIDTAKRTGLKGEELLKATAEFYDEVIENTQSMSDVLHRPEIQKKDGVIAESFAMFKTDLYQMAGQLQVTAGRWATDKSKANTKALVRTLYSIAMNAVWGQLMTTVFALLRYKVNQYRDDEDEDLTFESWMKRQGFSFAGDLMGYIFPIFGSEVVGFFENIMYGESDDLVDSVAISAINDLYDSMITIGTSITDGEWPDPTDMRKLTAKVLQIFGIPANNIERTWNAILLHAKDIANGEFFSFEAGADRTSGDHMHRIVESFDAGNTDVAVGMFNDAVEDLATKKADGGEYGDDEVNDAKSDLKKALGDKYKAGEVSEETTTKILSEVFGMDEDDIYWTLDKWGYAKENGSSDSYAKYDDFFVAVETGKNLKAVIKEYTDNGVSTDTLKTQITDHFKPLYVKMSTAEKANIKGYILNAMTALGDDREEAEKKLREWEFESKYGFPYDDKAKAYKEGTISASKLKTVLMSEGGMTEEEADLQIEAYNWEKQGYEGVTPAAVRDYNEHCASSGVPKDVYLHIRSFSGKTKNDTDANGETIYYSAMKKVMAEINSQYGLTLAQKTAIARSLGWSEKNIQKYKPW